MNLAAGSVEAINKNSMRNERGGIRDLNYSTQHAQRCEPPLTLTRSFVAQSQRRPIRSFYSPSGSGLERTSFRAGVALPDEQHGADQCPGQQEPKQNACQINTKVAQRVGELPGKTANEGHTHC